MERRKRKIKDKKKTKTKEKHSYAILKEKIEKQYHKGTERN